MSDNYNASGNPPSTASGGDPNASYLRPAVGWYLVFVLMVIYVISFVDRQILALLVKPIRAALEISDGQMGLLMGFAFALFYTFFGIPLGFVADRYSRRILIAAGLVLWSVMTMGCGLANQFATLLFFRIGVGVGEAALSPAAYSMIADAFPPRLLATAISVYSMGIYLGSGLAILFGGLIVKYAEAGSVPALPLVGSVAPWQFVFFVVGLIGLPVALLLFTLPEPKRHKSASTVSFTDTFAYIGKHRAAFFLHSTGFGLLALVGYASMGWIPTFFVRAHAWTIPDVSFYYGISIFTLGSLGIVAGGFIADRLRHQGFKDGAMRTCILSAVLALPCMVLFPLMGSGTLSMLVVAAVTFTTSLASGVAPAVIQQMMPPAMRGQASALYLFIVNIIAMGAGPTSVGLLNSYVFGDTGIHKSLITVGVVGCVGAALLLLAGLAPFRVASAEVEARTAPSA